MIGRTLAHYEVTALLGKGGMGEVYHARDTKLGRDVALKVLPREIGDDPERLARFRREARVLASLNHPNIAAIHGLEEAEGTIFLVLELADGLDLEQRLRQGALSVEEAVNVARQLALGLEQAHERGVVHRDLKPANVKLAADGTVKILDFGLARAYAGESAQEGHPATSPTITAAMTQAGTILGTAAYMSPEQARGHEVDRRADIWAFGVILFEMLTGKRLFEGETISDTLAEVLKTEPDFEQLPDDTPPALNWLVTRCLQKRPSKRLRDIGEARVWLESDLDEVPASTIVAAPVIAAPAPRWFAPAIVIAALTALAIGFVGAQWFGGDGVAEPAVHAAILPPAGAEFHLDSGGHFALSPDGERIAFVAIDSTGDRSMWVRRVDSPEAYVLSGTGGASYPFWSPDSQKIAFFADGRLKRIDATGGVPVAIAPAANGRGGAWVADDRIVFAFEVRDALVSVSAQGGTPVAVTTMDSLHWSHRWPVALPGGRHVVYTASGDVDELRWRPVNDPSQERVLLTGAHNAAFGDGHLFFGRDGALWARPLDPGRGEFLGEEFLVAQSVVTSPNFDRAAFSVAVDGRFVHVVGEQVDDTIFEVFDADMRRIDRFEIDDERGQDPNLSPDGRSLALAIFPNTDTGSDVWVRDLERGTQSRITFGASADDPAWGPAGDRIAYAKSGENRIVVQSTRGSRPVLLDVETGVDPVVHDWSPDGRLIVFTVSEAFRQPWLLPLDDPDAAYPMGGEEDFFVIHPTFSPDSQWLAYARVDGGVPRIFIRSLAPDGGTWQVTADESVEPRWWPDGSGIVYADEDGLRSVDVTFDDGEPVFGVDRRLLEVTLIRGRSNTHRYDISDDGQRFVLQVDAATQRRDTMPMDLVLGWRRGLDSR